MNKTELIPLLNKALSMEYGAAIQYMQHAAVIKGFWKAFADELAAHAEEELCHAKLLNDWINYWGGIPLMDPSPRFSSSDDRALIVQDLAGEDEAIALYREILDLAMGLNEQGLVLLLQQILLKEEEHRNDLQTMLGA